MRRLKKGVDKISKARRKILLRQSGVLPFIEEEGELKILLVTPRRGKRWIIPKGNLEKDMSAGESAAKEAYEEAGVVGSLSSRPVGYFEYRKGNGRTHFRVAVYLLRIEGVLTIWPESSERKRRFFKLEKALKTIQDKKLKLIAARLPELQWRAR